MVINIVAVCSKKPVVSRQVLIARYNCINLMLMWLCGDDIADSTSLPKKEAILALSLFFMTGFGWKKLTGPCRAQMQMQTFARTSIGLSAIGIGHHATCIKNTLNCTCRAYNSATHQCLLFLLHTFLRMYLRRSSFIAGIQR